MPKLQITGFDGIIPRESPTMLGDSQAQQADNVKLYSKELRYWRGATSAFTPSISNVASIFKHYGASSSYWLTWQNDVNVVLSPTTDTTDYRIYYTGDGVPKKSNESLISTGSGAYPRGWYNMGVPAPTAAATVTGGSVSRTVTISVAAPAVVSLTAHGFQLGAPVQFSTTGTLPTGLATGTTYYIVSITTDTFQVSATLNGTAITTTAAGSGTHSVFSVANPESRAYVYTYVSTFGSVTEESAPSPASSIITVYTGAAVTINSFASAPTTNYNITSRRIYRTVSGTTSDNYLFVAEIPISTSSYTDNLTAAQLGTALGTIGWVPPPSDLAGIVALPSGALAGFSGNTVYFSEPFYPHAWPYKYAVNIPHKIVGIGVFGSSVVVATDRYPHLINGGIPGSMSVERVPILEPCISKRSLVSDQSGVLYASPNGLVSIGYSNRGVVTNALFRRDEWQAINPSYITATTYDGKYIATYTSAFSGVNSFVLSTDDIPALSKVQWQANAVHVDSRTGNLYICASADGVIYQLDADELNPLTYTWKSKRFALPQPTTFSAMRVDADYGQSATASAYQAQVAAIKAHNATLFSGDLLGALNTAPINQSYSDSFYSSFPYRGITLNGSILSDIPSDASARTVQVLVYGDSVLKTTLTFTSFDAIRIPPFKTRDIELQVRGNISVRSVTMATTVQELHQ